MREIVKEWFRELLKNEIDSVKGTIENERMWELGCVDDFNPHGDNIIAHEEYLSVLEKIKEDCLAD